jgi:hypothetical protein
MLDVLAFISSQRQMREQFQMPRTLASSELSADAAPRRWRSHVAAALRVVADGLEPVSTTKSDAAAVRWSLNAR